MDKMQPKPRKELGPGPAKWSGLPSSLTCVSRSFFLLSLQTSLLGFSDGNMAATQLSIYPVWPYRKSFSQSTSLSNLLPISLSPFFTTTFNVVISRGRPHWLTLSKGKPLEPLIIHCGKRMRAAPNSWMLEIRH